MSNRALQRPSRDRSVRMFHATRLFHVSNISWVAVLAVGLSVAILIPSAGCGGKRERRRAAGPGAAGETENAVADPAETSNNAVEQPDTNTDPYSSEPVEEPPVEAVEPTPPEPARPEDVAEWSAEDFLSAKIDKDESLAAAVEHLDEHRRDDEDAAKILFGLLSIDDPPAAEPEEPDDQEPDPYGGGRGGPGGYEGREIGRGGGYGEGGYGGYGGSGVDPEKIQIDAGLAEKVVAALGRNATQVGRQLIHQLVGGRFPTPLNSQTLFAATMDAMLENPHSEHDAVLYVLVTNTEKIVPAPTDNQEGGFRSGGGLSPDQVRRDVLRRVGEEGSIAIRQKIAEYLDSPEVTTDLGDELERVLSQDDPRNLPAQIVMFKSSHTSAQTLNTIRQRLTQGSRAAYAFLLGMDAEDTGFNSFSPGRGGGYGGEGRGRGPRGLGGFDRLPVKEPRLLPGPNAAAIRLRPDASQQGNASTSGGWFAQRRGDRRGARGDDGEEEVDRVAVYKSLAALLWTDAMAKQIAAHLLDADNLSEHREQVRMLASMPGPAARKLTHDIFEEFRDEGPQPFASAGFMGNDAINPTFLLVAKSAYHGKKSKRRSSPSGTRRGGGRGGEQGFGGGNSEEDQWTREIENFIGIMTQRFAEAESPWPVEAADENEAESPADEDGKSGEGDETPAGPREAMEVRLHRGAEDGIEAEYHLRWPDNAQARLPAAKVAPMEVHYLRIEQETTPQKMMSFYRKAAGPGSKTHTSSGQVWYDGLTTSRQTGLRRSVDVILRNKDASNSGLRPTEARDMSIEILVIAMPDAADAAAEAN